MNSDITMASLSYSSVQDPLVRRFVDEVAALFRAEIVQALAAQKDPAKFRVKFQPTMVGGATSESHLSMGMVVAEQFKQLPESRRQALLRRNSSVMKIATGIANSAGVDLRSEKPVLDQVDLRARFAFVNEHFAERLVQSTNELMAVVRVPADEAGQNGAGAAKSSLAGSSRGIKLNLEQVRCVDETDPEFFGSDEIALGGTAFSDDETTSIIKEFLVGEGFDDGDSKRYNPPRLLKSFSLPTGGKFPKTYSAMLSLAEKDNGGFADFLQKLFEAAKAEIAKILSALGAAAGAALGGAIGGSIGTTLAGPLGTVIGAVAGLALGAIIATLIDAFRDDVFEPQLVTFALPKANATFPGGSTRSPTLSLTYKDHGGTYRLSYHWQIVR